MTDEAKVTLNPTPSAELVAKAQTEQTVTDALGRVIKLRKPGVLAQYRIVDAMGASASNQAYMAMVLPLLFVSAINADPVPPLGTKREVEALIQRLDDEGVAAVMAGVQEHFGAQDPEADQASLKN